MDDMTGSKADLVLNDKTASKTPSKIPIILAGIFAAGTIVLLITTIVLALQKNDIAAELDKLKATPKPEEKPELCTTKQCFDSSFVYLDSMEQTKNPCDNFFEYACGGWTERYTVPDDRTSFSTFNLLRDDVTDKLKVLVERETEASDPASYQKVKDDYKSCIDLDTINTLGATPLTDVLVSLGGWPVLGASLGGSWNSAAFDFEKSWADIRGTYGVEMIVATGVWPDPTNTVKHKLEAYTPQFVVPQSDIEMKHRQDVYSLIDERDESADYGVNLLLGEKYSKVCVLVYFVELTNLVHFKLTQERQAYLQYLIDIAVALGADVSVATEDMTDLIEFETTMANMTIIHADSVRVENTLDEIGMGLIDWEGLYQLMMPASVFPIVTSSEPIVNYRPNYIGNVTMWLKDQRDRVKANYMIWRLVSRMVPYLNETFLDIRQKYLSAVQGTTTAADRWKTCVNTAKNQFEFITGRMYVDVHFPENAKQKTLEMIKNLQTAFKSMLETNDWLQEVDKGVAAEKADAMDIAIGYPDWIKENDKLDAKYTGFTVKDNEYFKNSLNYREWISQTTLALLRKDVEEDSLWTIVGPAVVNAFYSPSTNGILFPAAILQPPFYHHELPWYSNYGGIGVVIGHEITHGFDNNGRQYDKDGNYRVWWSQESIDNFIERAQCIIDQYTGFVMPENNRHLNGEQTQGENIADNGGLRESYKAYMDNIPKQPRLPGVDFTEEQMFFISFSQIWCTVLKPEGADNYIDNQVHSPGRYRVIGPLQNNEAFAAAFNCPVGSYMNPANKCKIWY